MKYKNDHMSKVRWLSLLLALMLLASVFVSCDGDGGGGNVDGGGISDDGSVSWDEVDFKGSTLRYAVSVHERSGGTFQPAYAYLKGPDASTTDEVMKKVISRNTLVEEDLNLKVEYVEVSPSYSQIVENIKGYVLGSAEDSPDLYTNDMGPMCDALVEGYFFNIATPTDRDGNPLTSYFDFANSVWHYDFMSDLSLDKSKVYLLASDYHIDIVRCAYVLFVNKTMFDQNAKSLGAGSTAEFYEYVLDGIWDYDMLADMCRSIWKDDGATKNLPDKKDSRMGLLIDKTVYWSFIPSTGISTYYMGEDGKPKMIEDIDEMNRMGAKVRMIWENGGIPHDGIYYESDLDCTSSFMQGKALFVPSLLGELESEEFRDVSFDKGLVPMPKYDSGRQESYHTMHSVTAELSAILITSQSFSAASAYMQYMAENSRPVLTEYYEFSLKFKYNDDPAIRSMIDLVYGSVDSPFGMHFENIIFRYLSEEHDMNLHYAISINSLGTFYDQWKGPYRAALDKAITEFAKIK